MEAGPMTTAEDARARTTRRSWLAAGITAAVLALAIAAGARTSTAAPGPLMFVESLAVRVSGRFLWAGTKLPLGYAFVAGMVASVNPCGFVLLPAYLGYYLGDGESATARARAGRALLVSVTVTASF